MKVWNGSRWLEKIRVFAGRVNGASIFQYPTGTQAGLNISVRSGLLLFDDDSRIESDWVTNHIKCLDFFNADISSGVSNSPGTLS